jgi:thioredoxin 1
MAVTTLNKDNFQKDVLDYKGIVFVDFYADWCEPCKVTSPIIEELADEYKNVKFMKVDVDSNPDLSSQYSVFSIPTFMIFKNGKLVSQLVGARGKENFVEELKKATS